MLRCQSKRLTLLNQITLFSSFVVIKLSKMVDIQSSFRPVILLQLLYLINPFHSSFWPPHLFHFSKIDSRGNQAEKSENKDRQQQQQQQKQNLNSVIPSRTFYLTFWPQQIPWITAAAADSLFCRISNSRSKILFLFLFLILFLLTTSSLHRLRLLSH